MVRVRPWGSRTLSPEELLPSSQLKPSLQSAMRDISTHVGLGDLPPDVTCLSDIIYTLMALACHLSSQSCQLKICIILEIQQIPFHISLLFLLSSNNRIIFTEGSVGYAESRQSGN